MCDRGRCHSAPNPQPASEDSPTISLLKRPEEDGSLGVHAGGGVDREQLHGYGQGGPRNSQSHGIKLLLGQVNPVSACVPKSGLFQVVTTHGSADIGPSHKRLPSF